MKRSKTEGCIYICLTISFLRDLESFIVVRIKYIFDNLFDNRAIRTLLLGKLGKCCVSRLLGYCSDFRFPVRGSIFSLVTSRGPLRFGSRWWNLDRKEYDKSIIKYLTWGGYVQIKFFLGTGRGNNRFRRSFQLIFNIVSEIIILTSPSKSEKVDNLTAS